MFIDGVIHFFHDEVGVFFEFLYFEDFWEVAILVEGVHDLVLFLYEDDFAMMFLNFAGIVFVVLFMSDSQNEAEGAVSDGVENLIGLFESFLGRLFVDHCCAVCWV